MRHRPRLWCRHRLRFPALRKFLLLMTMVLWESMMLMRLLTLHFLYVSRLTPTRRAPLNLTSARLPGLQMMTLVLEFGVTIFPCGQSLNTWVGAAE